MDFSFTEEQTMLKDSVRRFLKDAYPFDTYTQIVESSQGYSPAIWQQFGELQWQGVGLAEADGGLGYGATELLLLSEELGRGLCVEPYLANAILAGQAIARLASAEQRQRLLPGLLDGSRQISLAWVETQGRYNPLHCSTRAERDGENWRLSGHKSVVLNAPNADQIVVIARHSGDTADGKGLGAYLIDATAGQRQDYAVLGGGTAAELVLDGVAAERLGGEAAEVLQDVLDLAIAASCAEAYGAMQAMLEKTVEYSKTRKQFGMPLGSFQALQHRMVDMFVEVQQTQSMILMVMLKLASDDRIERQKAVSACKAYVHKSSKFVAQQSVQLHGGIGVTEELDIGHYFRRLTAFGSLFGDRAYHLRRYAALTRSPAVVDRKLAAVA